MNRAGGKKEFREMFDKRLANPGFAEEYAKAKIETEFAVAVAAAREARGLTQAQLADKMHCKQQMVARYEKGQLPALPMLQRLATALGALITIDSGGRFNLSLTET